MPSLFVLEKPSTFAHELAQCGNALMSGYRAVYSDQKSTWSRFMQQGQQGKGLSKPDMRAEDYAVICDFDGTVTPFDVTDAILERFAEPSWKTIEDEWVRGAISARECMERQVPLIAADPSILESFLDGVPITDGFVDFVKFCRAKDIPLTIVSDGMDYAIEHILHRHGVRHVPVVANRLLRSRSGYRLEFPYGKSDCPSGVCKCFVASIVAPDRKRLLVGDGLSDCCLAGSASFILARHGKSLQRHCLEHGYQHQTYLDFFDILELFEAASPHPSMMPSILPAL